MNDVKLESIITHIGLGVMTYHYIVTGLEYPNPQAEEGYSIEEWETEPTILKKLL